MSEPASLLRSGAVPVAAVDPGAWVAERVTGSTVRRRLYKSRLRALGWWVASVALFAGLWELAYAFGWLNPLLLPPPHIFLNDFTAQAKNFDTARIGQDPRSPALAVLGTILATVGRVGAGLVLGATASLVVGISVTYVRLVGRLTLPTITLLAPISPLAWLPVAIFLFGIGNGPAVFMVFIGVFFIMTLATIAQIESVAPMYLDVAATMGASRFQTLRHVVLPAILPGLFMVLRLNLFAAWLVVLIAEAVGVGSGLGQVVLLARNTFNSSLVFFTMTIIGLTGFLLDALLRMVQRKLLWWQTSSTPGVLR